jgi:putative ABC transport system permease protein
MAIVALAIALALLIPALWVARKATLRRLAWRNVTSSPAEAALITVGTMLGTAIIVASFVVGDTIEDGVGSLVDTSLGPIDESVTIEDPSQLGALASAVDSADLGNVDGTIAVLSLPTAVTTGGTDPIGEPSVWIAEIDFDDARSFGLDPPTSGFADAGATPGPGEVVVTTRLAGQLDLVEGDAIEVHAYGDSYEFTVRDIIDRFSAAGWNSAYVAPGTIANMAPPEASSTGPMPRAEVLVSNTGDFESGAVHSDAVVSQIEAATSSIGLVTIEAVKQDTLDSATADGNEFTTLFNGIGSFAVIAGILLIVNLFVMLAEERKTPLGIMRAIGFKRSEVTKAFAIEGSVYSVAASVIGVVVGVGVGWVLVQVLSQIFFDDIDDLEMGFAVQADSLMLAAAIGLGITMLTIWFTARRISRFNVIAAVRDLPQPPTKRGRVRTILLALVGLAAGAGLAYLGLTQDIQTAAMAGVPIAAFSLIPLIRPVVGERAASVLAGLAALAWGVFVFNLFPEVMQESDIEVFVVQGVVLVAAAVILSASASKLWSKMVDGLSRVGAGLSTRLGLVYPLARKGRTGLLLGMFSLVIFTITFLAVFSVILGEQTQGLADDSRAGYDIIATSAGFNPSDEDDLAAVEGVGEVAPLLRARAEFVIEGDDDPEAWLATGFDESLLANGSPVLGSRGDAYSTDLEVFEATLADPSLIIIDDFFLDTEDGPGGERYAPGAVVEVIAESGEKIPLTIAGVLASDWVFAGSYVSAAFAETHLDPLPGRYYVTATEGQDPEVVAGRLNAALIDNGMQAETFSAGVEAEVGETVAIFRLFQGFLSLGLLIGVAGLSVVLVRAVRERRRAIGVLRALGTPEGVVRRAFLIEAGFVAAQGVAIGAGLGLITAYQVIVSSNTFGDTQLGFVWPWAGLALIMIVPTVAALLAAASPAKRASRIAPAVALRTE